MLFEMSWCLLMSLARLYPRDPESTSLEPSWKAIKALNPIELLFTDPQNYPNWCLWDMDPKYPNINWCLLPQNDPNPYLAGELICFHLDFQLIYAWTSLSGSENDRSNSVASTAHPPRVSLFTRAVDMQLPNLWKQARRLTDGQACTSSWSSGAMCP